MKNRVVDMVDPFTLEVSIGPGVHGFAQITDYLGTGLGVSRQYGVWLHGRYYGSGKRETVGLVVMAISGANYDDCHMYPILHGDVYTDRLIEDNIYNDARGSMYFFLPTEFAFFGPKNYSMKNRWYRILDISLGASCGLGLHGGISPGEFADFIVGLFSFDFGDDYFGSSEKSVEKRPSTPLPGEGASP